MSKVSRCALALLGPFTLIVGFAVINNSIPQRPPARSFPRSRKRSRRRRGKEPKKDKKSKEESAPLRKRAFQRYGRIAATFQS